VSESNVEETHEGGVSCQNELCRFAGNRELKSGSRLQEVNSYERNTYFIISQIFRLYCKYLANIAKLYRFLKV